MRALRLSVFLFFVSFRVASAAETYQPVEHFKSGLSAFSLRPTLTILGAGASLTALSFLADDKIKKFYAGKNRMQGWRQMGNMYGDIPFQFGSAALILAAGISSNSPEFIDFGESNLEALSFATGIGTAVKYTVRRDRPSGGKTSFPSAHTTQAFVTAGTLWNLGDPILSSLSILLGALTAASRLDANKHYFSDTVAGATLGFVSGYAFSLHHQKKSPTQVTWNLIPIFESRNQMGIITRIRF